MIREELVFVATCDISGLARGKGFPARELPARLKKGVGWTGSNLMMSPFGPIWDTPFGTAGDFMIVPGWTRTHYDFKVRPVGDPRGLYACRFFGTPGIGPNSHFFTINHDECALVRANPFWTFEGLAFNADPPALDQCPADRVPVIRLYNNGKGGQAKRKRNQ